MRNNKCILCQDNLIHYSVKESYRDGLLYEIKEKQMCSPCNYEILIINSFVDKKSINICINDFMDSNEMICMINISYNKKKMSFIRSIWIESDYYNLKIDIDNLTMEYAIESIKKAHSNLIFK